MLWTIAKVLSGFLKQMVFIRNWRLGQKNLPNSPEAKSWISNQKRVSEEADGAAPSGAVIASIPNPAQTVVGQKKKKKSKEIGHILRRYGKPT